MSSQRHESDSFRFKRAAFYQSLKSKVALAAAKANKSGGVEDRPRRRGLWHSGSPSARSLSRSPSPPPPSYTQSPSPPRSLVRDGQTNPHRPRSSSLVAHVLHYPPSPHANSFIIGTAEINTHWQVSHTFLPLSQPRARDSPKGRRRRGCQCLLRFYRCQEQMSDLGSQSGFRVGKLTVQNRCLLGKKISQCFFRLPYSESVQVQIEGA